ncbi:bZIP transcription factor bZIP-1 [Penicillium malachiteum]|nr:bZIP transcription factor bZIP-1 [Penicillium malachiteum]
MPDEKPPTAEPRKRGRPRVLTDDKEVPERRRKQLRVAQQAYRKRKETTITTLQTRVADLGTGIEKLSQSFLSFSTLLIEENLLSSHPNIASALQDITRQCVSLAQQSSNESEQQASPEVVEELARNPPIVPQVAVNLDFDTEIVGSDITLSSLSSQSSPTPSMGINQWDLSFPPTPPYQEQAMLPFGIVLSEPTLPPSLPLPQMTFSPEHLIQQTPWSLTHHIVRECSYQGYRLLTYAPHDAARIQRVFGTILTKSERENILSGFYSVITDYAGDMVDQRTKVLSPLHPRKDVFSLDQLAHSSRSWQLVAESGPGQWLDACGVQRFLQERGIDIQPDSTLSSGFRIKPGFPFDVNIFIRVISSDCICVGPGPAFRRRTVEKALLQAISNDPWAYVPPCTITDSA